MSLVTSRHGIGTYKDVLSPTVYITALFNSEAIAKSRFGRFLEKALFILLFVGLSFIAMLAVFARSGIDTWIQFSLYIVPLFSMICGHLIFSSSAFKEILSNPIGRDGSNANETEFETTFDNISSFLRKRSLKMCFYPVSLVLYQWTVYLMFFYDKGSSEFSGPRNISEHSSYVTRSIDLDLDQETWLPLYYIFWTIAMYVSGFIGCCFILVVDIHKLDIKSFLCKIGNGPLIQKRTRSNYHSNVYSKTRITNHGKYRAVDTRVTTPVGLCFRVLSLVTGFLTLGLVELGSGPPWEAEQMSGVAGHEDSQNDAGTQNDAGDRNDVGEVSDSGITNGLSSSLALENGNEPSSSGERGGPPKTITPREASELLIQLMSNLETNSALFKPFLVLLTFFSVTNLVTHVVAMAVVNINGFTDRHWWTLVRTLFWFLLAIRLLWTVATITKTLSRIIPHIYYLRSVGQLAGAKEEWNDFFQLAETFQFGSRTYGFPLTLNQVASIVAVVNFSFLIVLSLISKAQ